MEKIVAVNEVGLRIGEDHPRAKLTDREVDLIRQMHESGLGYRKLSRMFDISRSHVRDIVKCTKRAQVTAGHRVVRLPDG